MFDDCKCSDSFSSFGRLLVPPSFVPIRFIHSDIVLKFRPRTKTNILAFTLNDIFDLPLKTATTKFLANSLAFYTGGNAKENHQ